MGPITSHEFVVTSHNRYAYVTNYDVSSDQIARSFHVGSGSEGIHWQTRQVNLVCFGSARGRVIRFSLQKWQPVGAIHTDPTPDSLAFILAG
jgi:hypothetical protein